MVDIEDIKRDAHVNTDEQGNAVVQFPLNLWEEWLTQNNDSPQTTDHSSDSWESQPWTEAEIKDFLTFEPASGAEIVASGLTGVWSDLNITDSVAWVEEVR